MSHVLLAPRAEQDLEEIGDYIAVDNPSRARSFVQEIRARFPKIADTPLAYPRRPELGDAIRACLHGRYAIFFKIESSNDSIVILRILHGARDPSSFSQQS